MNRFFTQRFFVLALTALALAPAVPAQAAQRPHVSRGTAQFVNNHDFVGAGSATHLGAYKEEAVPNSHPPPTRPCSR